MHHLYTPSPPPCDCRTERVATVARNTLKKREPYKGLFELAPKSPTATTCFSRSPCKHFASIPFCSHSALCKGDVVALAIQVHEVWSLTSMHGMSGHGGSRTGSSTSPTGRCVHALRMRLRMGRHRCFGTCLELCRLGNSDTLASTALCSARFYFKGRPA